MRRRLLSVLPLLLAVAAPIEAAPNEAAIRATVQGIAPDAVVERITATPIDGLVEVVANGTILYITEDGRYMLHGDLLDTTARVSLTEWARSAIRADTLAKIDPAWAIRFAPEKPKHEVYVMTDPTCGYCKKMHAEIQQYMDAGIAVNYLAWPRGPEGTDPYVQSQSVWCSADKHQALTDAKAGRAVPTSACTTHPIAQLRAMGDRLGIQGTPAIFDLEGHHLGGYVSATALAAQLDAYTGKRAP